MQALRTYWDATPCSGGHKINQMVTCLDQCHLLMVLTEPTCCGLMTNLLLHILICDNCVFNFLRDASWLVDY